MTTVRVGVRPGHPLCGLAERIAAAVRKSAAESPMTCAVFIGVEDPYIASIDDERPRLVVPLAWPQSLGRLPDSTIATAADCLVLMDRLEMTRIPCLPDFSGTVHVMDAGGSFKGTLDGPGFYEKREFLAALRESPDLQRTIASAQGASPGAPEDLAAEIASVVLRVADEWRRAPITGPPE